MEINLAELWHSMGTPVRVVVIVLTIQAVACIAVAIDRIALLVRTATRSREFAAQAGPLLEDGDYEGVLAVAARAKRSHLAAFMYAGVKTFLDRRVAGDNRGVAADRTRRMLERKGESLSESLNRGMGVLASTGSTAPFVGLLGTVLGIINAFKLIAASGSGGIGTIGAAIGEALVVTGYGLCVAIPAVLVFNALSTRINQLETGLVNAASELVDNLEVGGGWVRETSSPGLEEAEEARGEPTASVA